MGQSNVPSITYNEFFEPCLFRGRCNRCNNEFFREFLGSSTPNPYDDIPAFGEVIPENQANSCSAHVLDLLRFSGHGEEDGAKREGAVVDISYGAEEALDFEGSFLFVEAGVDEANYGICARYLQA
jgi:hypothetical protein